MKKRINKIIAAVMAIMMMCAGTSCGSSDMVSTSDVYKSAGLTMDAAAYETNGGIMYEASSEEYEHGADNTFVKTAEHPLSTFSTDVDTASFTNVRRMLENGYTVDPDAVRAEEFINFFKYDYPAPQQGSTDKLSIYTELSDCPWNSGSKLMMIGLQAQEVEVKDIDSNIVFLIDVSGSMYSENKLPLVQQAFTMLTENLGQNDRISIVTYAGNDKVELDGENGGNHDKIIGALESLSAGGGTAGAAGINTAYELAEKYFIEGGNNRVILATDGDLNIGVSSKEELTELIESKRDKGIYLSVLGFGTGNYKDNKLEALADNGNGNYAYIDTLDEARRVLVTEMNGTLFTVAKDAKVQVEFAPEKVSEYKLVGYENRLLADEDFEDDTKDAGDIGAGQQVTVLYEIVPVGYESEKRANSNSGETVACSLDGIEGKLAGISVRYKERDENESKLIEASVDSADFKAPETISDNMKLSCAAAMLASSLRHPENKLSAEFIGSYAADLSLDSGELVKMLEKYKTL